MNTYVSVELLRNCMVEAKTCRAKSFKEALIALEFEPYDPWGDFAVAMHEEGLITEERLYELGKADYPEVAQAISEYAVKHWGAPGSYILEIKPDGSVTARPELTNRLEVM